MERRQRDAFTIIQTKIQRPPTRLVLDRPRLFERLDEGARRKLTVVSAPAGYGKTTLVSSWLECGYIRYIWINLDTRDQSAQQLLAYLSAAFCTSQDPPGTRSPVDTGFGEIVNRLFELEEDLVIVLDDYHLAESPGISDLIQSFVEAMPRNAHLVLITRSDPSLRVAKLRGRDELVELRETDLRFTADETTQFITTVSRLSLDGADLASLSRITEGWIAGLQMIAASLRDTDEPSAYIQNLRVENRYLLDYLVEEVLSRLDTYVLDFLLRCSIVEKMCAGLCNAITDRTDGQRILDDIDRRNYFITPLDESKQWYRLHNLFGDLLQLRLRQQYPEELPLLHCAAAEWFESSGQIVEAIDHRIASLDYDAAARLIEQYGEDLIMRGELRAWMRWTEQIPENTMDRFPLLLVLNAERGLMRGEPLEQIERRLQRVEAGSYDAMAECLRCFIAIVQGRTADALEMANELLSDTLRPSSFVSGVAQLAISIDYAEHGKAMQAIEMLEGEYNESLKAGNLLFAATALNHQGDLWLRLCDLNNAMRSYTRASDLAPVREGSSPWISAPGKAGCGEVMRLRGSVEESITYYREGLRGPVHKLLPSSVEAYIGLAHAYASLGHIHDADRSIEAARKVARDFAVTEFDDRVVEAHRILILLKTGRGAGIGAVHEPAVRNNGRTESYLEAYVTSLESLSRSRILLERGDIEGSLSLAKTARETARRKDITLFSYEADLTIMRGFWRKHESDQVRPLLGRILDLFAAQGLVQPIVDEGEEMARLLYGMRAAGFEHEHLGTVLAAFPLNVMSSSAADSQQSSVDSLSAREIEVLALLERGLPNKQIASELCISERTVKWHTTNIYAKLNVKSRTQAVAAARRLDILPE